MVEVVKASLDLTGKYPNTNKRRIGFLDECTWKISYTSQRRAVGIAPLIPGKYNFKRLLKFIGLKNIKKKILLNRNYSCDQSFLAIRQQSLHTGFLEFQTISLLQKQAKSRTNGEPIAWQILVMLTWGNLPSSGNQIRSYLGAPTNVNQSIEIWTMLCLEFDVLSGFETPE